jgi:hypothetical protein
MVERQSPIGSMVIGIGYCLGVYKMWAGGKIRKLVIEI